MKNLFVLISIMVFFFNTVAAREEYREESIDNDYSNEIKELASKEKNLVLFFHQSGCPYCDKMRSRVHPSPMVVDYFNINFVMMDSNIKGNLEITMPDGTKGTERDFAKKLRIRATPVYIFYNREGKQALRITGYFDEKSFFYAGKYVVEEMYNTKKSFFRYLQEKR